MNKKIYRTIIFILTLCLALAATVPLCFAEGATLGEDVAEDIFGAPAAKDTAQESTEPTGADIFSPIGDGQVSGTSDVTETQVPDEDGGIQKPVVFTVIAVVAVCAVSVICFIVMKRRKK